MEDNANFDEDFESVQSKDIPKSNFEQDFDPVSSSTGNPGDADYGVDHEPGMPFEGVLDAPNDQDTGNLIELELPKNFEPTAVTEIGSSSGPAPTPPAESADENSASTPGKPSEIGQPSVAHREEEHGDESSACGCWCAWLSNFTLPSSVRALILWHDIPLTGTTLFGSFMLLLSLVYFSAISVVSYASLAVLVAAATFKVYRLAVAALCKDSAGSCYDFNPFRVLEEANLNLSPDLVHKAVDTILPYVNCVSNELKQLFLVESALRSLKFGLVLWALTYVGCCFNGLTLIILDLVAIFTLPKIYDTYKVQIDHQVAVNCRKFDEIYGKLKDRIPYLKKKTQ